MGQTTHQITHEHGHGVGHKRRSHEKLGSAPTLGPSSRSASPTPSVQRKTPSTGSQKSADGDEILIGVSGLAGLDKSEFIRLILGSSTIQSDCGEDPNCPRHVKFSAPFQVDSRRVRLIEFPSFDSEVGEDIHTLNEIATHLAALHVQGRTLAGVVYLHDISKPRMSAVSQKNVEMFSHLVGKLALTNFLLVTTSWGKVDMDVGIQREENLLGLFRHVFSSSRCMRFAPSITEAQAILQRLLKMTPTALLIQTEIITHGKPVVATTAGVHLRMAISKDIASCEKELTNLTEDLKHVMKYQDELVQSALRADLQHYHDRRLFLEADSVMFPKNPSPQLEPRPSDETFICVMGRKGIGKSSFIRTANNASVDDPIESCNKSVKLSEQFRLGNERVRFVELPSFGDFPGGGTDTLNTTAAFLAALHRSGQKLGGIVYLHPICEVRITTDTRRNMLMLQSICGEDALSNVVIATTKRGHVDPDEMTSRERCLESLKLFAPALKSGAQVVRYDHTTESAHHIINNLLVRQPKALALQRFIINDGKAVVSTAAGQLLYSQLKNDREHCESLRKGVASYGKSLICKGMPQSKKEDFIRELQDKFVHLQAEMLKLSGARWLAPT